VNTNSPVVAAKTGRRWLLLAALAATPSLVLADVRIDRGILTVQNSSLSISFQGANLRSLKNLLTGDEYIVRQGPGWLDMSLQEATNELLKTDPWRLETDPESRETVAVTTAKDSVRLITIKVGLAADSGEIFLRFDGKSEKTGVRSVFFGLQGFNPEGGRFLIPGQAGIYFDGTTIPSTLDLQYPTHWEAQFSIYERKRGGVLIYARDPKPYFKRLRASRQYGTLDIGLDVFATGPWANATQTPPVEWRFKSFAGDWKKGVDAYRAWSETVWPTRTLTPRADWRFEVTAVVTLIDTVIEYLEPLSKRVDPRKTLLYLANWRRDSYDTNYPDYTPGLATAALIKRAHELGFRVMLHANALGVAQYNPAYAKVFPYQLRDPDKGELVYWPHGLWPAGTPPPFFIQSYAFISPCSSEYRAVLIDALRPAMEQLQPDALHLDAGGVMLNDGNGLIEGMTSIEGMIKLHQDLDAAFPGTAFSYESMTETLTGLQNFAQRWNASYPPHPISTYLMGRRITFYGFLNQTPPDEPGFIDYMNRYEAQGILPTFHIAKPTDLTGARPGNEWLLNLIATWQKHGFRPDWERDWGADVFRYISADGGTEAVVAESGNTVQLRIGDNVAYERIRRTTSARTGGFVRNWMAYDGDVLYGLDPQQEYWVDRDLEGPRDQVRISELPDGVSLSNSSFVSKEYGYFELRKVSPPTFDFVQRFQGATIGVSYALKDYPLGFGALVEITRTTVAGRVVGPVLLMQPPYQVPGAVVFVEYEIAVPALRPALKFAAGISDYGLGSDGAWFVARINGEDAWRAEVKRGQPVPGEVDLSRWAGQTVRLRLIVHPGAKLSYTGDLAIWSDLNIEEGSDEAPTAFRITLPKGSSRATLSEGARFKPSPAAAPAEPDEQQLDAEASLPAKFAVFAAPLKTIEIGASLLDFPSDVWKSNYGGWPFRFREGINGMVQPSVSGGERVPKVLATFPPSKGLTHVTWAVALPPDASRLTFRASLADPLPPLPPDIDYSQTAFTVKVNGQTLWNEVYQLKGWHDASVDISRWAGQNVVVEVSADALGLGTFNWAQWADLTVR
jgi:hypothetical protein